MRAVPRILLATSVASVLAACATTSSGPAETTASSTVEASASAPPTMAGATASDTSVVVITSADIPPPQARSAQLSPDAPRRIASLATGVGETLAALGVGDRVVGRDETSEAPSIDGAPVLTQAHAVSAERVLGTEPDLVIVDAATSPPEALEQIRLTGVPVVEVPEAWSLTDIGPRTAAIAQAVGIPPTVAAEVIADAISTSILPPGASPRPRVAFLYLRGTSAIYLLGGRGSGADALITDSGATDVGAQAGRGAFTPLTAEVLAEADPEILLVMTGGLESVGGVDGLVALPGVAQTRAGRDRRVVAVEDTLLLSFGPRTGALIDALARAWSGG